MVYTHDPEPVWDKEVDVPEKWIQSVDDTVAASMSFLVLIAVVRIDISRTAGWITSHGYISVRI